MKSRHVFHPRLAWLTLTLTVLSFLSFEAPRASAAPGAAQAAPTIPILVALAPTDKTLPLELTAVTLDAALSEHDGHMWATGNSTFKLHNTDVVNDVQTTVGFPTWAGSSYVFDPAQFDKFQAFVDERPAKLTRTPGPPLKIGAETRTADWFMLDLTFTNDQKRLVRVEFNQDIGTDRFPRFVYGMQTGSGWKGNVGSMRLSVQMPKPTTLEQFLTFDPFTPTFDGQTLSWRSTNFEPTANESVTLVRPSEWATVEARRAAVTQNPNDTNAHYALAQLYQDLASIASPRRDSLLALALAEMETASRLDPKNAAVLEQLAGLYETKGGPAAGPRDANYVALAMQQWQGLLGSRSDAEARKHLAEDSVFSAAAARGRGEYERALKLLDDARTFAPNGVGPLYTPDRWNQERKAAQTAWARALAEQGDLRAALAKAREANGGTYTLPGAPTLPYLVLTRAQVTTNSVERLIELRFVGLPESAPETDDAINALVQNLIQTGAAGVNLTANNTERVISLRVPYGSVQDLQNRQRALAAAMGDREDLATARALLVPAALEISSTQDTWNDQLHYREGIDLTKARGTRQARLDALTQALAALDKAKPEDDGAQLQRALLTDLRGWLQSAYAGGAAKFQFIAADNTRGEWTLNLSEQRELVLDHTSLRRDMLLLAGGAGGAVLIGLMLLAVVVTRLRRGRVE